MDYKKNSTIKVNYIALNKTTGLTDVTMYVYDELGALFTTVVMTELIEGSGVDPSGLYYGSFTPDEKGQWRVRIQSDTNGDDIQRVFEIGNYDVDDVKTQTQDIEDKVDTIDGNIDAIKTKTDNLPADTSSEITYMKNKLDSLDTQINPGGYILR